MAVVNICSALGQKDDAFTWLIKAVEQKSGIVVYLKVYGRTFLKELTTDPRYTNLLERVGFKE